MADVFIKTLNMGIAASWLILAVVVLRILLKGRPSASGCCSGPWWDCASCCPLA